jgi:hypothetical protein
MTDLTAIETSSDVKGNLPKQAQSLRYSNFGGSRVNSPTLIYLEELFKNLINLGCSLSSFRKLMSQDLPLLVSTAFL